MRTNQYDRHSADVFLNLILLYENVLLLIQINYDLIQMGQLTISQYWSIGPEQSSYQLQMLWHLMMGVCQ